MKIAKLNSTPIQTTREGILDNYYVVDDNYNFSGNSATDVTSYDNLAMFYGISRFSEKLFRESLIDNILPNFTGLSSSDQKNLVYKRIYPSGYTPTDIISLVGQSGYELVTRTISFTEFIESGDTINSTKLNYFTGNTAPSLYANKIEFNNFTATTDTAISNSITGGTTLGGYDIFSDSVANRLRFKGLVAGTNVTITPSSTGLTISASASGSTSNSMVGLEYKYDNTLGSPPSTQYFRFNAVNASTVTEVYIHRTANNFVNFSVMLNQIKAGAKLYIQNLRDSNESVLYNVLTDVVDNTTYFTFSVDFVSSGGDTIFTNDDRYGLVFTQTDGFVKTDVFNTYTGTTAPNQYASKSAFLLFTGTTAPATYQTRASIATLTGTTLPNQYAAKSAFLTYTGITAPATYLTKSVFNTYTGSTIITANNGLTNVGSNIRLGGSLTGNTTINALTSILSLTGTSGQFNVDRTSGSLNFASRNAITLVGKNTGGATRVTLKLSATGTTFSDATATGIIYGADYSSGFVPRTLVDKGYVTGLTSQLLTTASNGVRKIGTNFRLGGSLTGNTNIGLGTFNLVLTGSTGTLRYGSDLSAQYNVRSLVDKGYVTGTTQSLITFRNNATVMNTPPNKFSTVNFSSGVTLVDRGSGLLEAKVLYGSELFNTGRTTVATNATTTMTDYLAKGFVLAGGTYKVEYCARIFSSNTGGIMSLSLVVDGASMEPVINNYRSSAASDTIPVNLFTVRTFTAGSHSFRLQFATTSGTMTVNYAWIIITRLS